jgi:hypothetical protein
MRRTVCSPLPGLDTRAHHLHKRLPPSCPAYALSDRWRVSCVIGSYASTTGKGALTSQQRRRNDSCRLTPRHMWWEYHADRCA